MFMASKILLSFCLLRTNHWLFLSPVDTYRRTYVQTRTSLPYIFEYVRTVLYDNGKMMSDN